jgi:plasmid stability protein
MPELVIRDMDDATLERLRRRAAEHAHSTEVEAKWIITEVLRSPAVDSWAVVNTMREELARSGRKFPDSTPLVREDRDR